jgi:glycosyltransferase involved in cell wall biosynthesis
MRILHALAYYGNYFGGIQHSVNEITKRQRSLGHDVKIVTSDMFGSSDLVDGVPVRRLKTAFEAFRVPLMPSLPFVLAREDYDVLHVYLPLPYLDMAAAYAKKIRPKAKLVLSIRNFLPNPASIISRVAGSVHNNFTINVAIRTANAVIFTNRQFASSVPYHVPAEKQFIVPNGIDTETFHPNADSSYDPNQLLFVGRLVPEKGLEILMRAMRIVQATLPNVKLVAVVTDYYNQKQYLEKVLSLDNHFLELSSRLPLEELAQLYRESAVFVLPSIGLESFGNVLIEAMASGCPVISTDMPGPKDLVESGANYGVGTVVSKGNFEELAKAIISETRNSSKERRAKIAEYARTKGSWDEVAEQLLTVYEKC